MPALTLDPALARRVAAGSVGARPVTVAPAGPALRAEIDALVARRVAEHAGRAPSAIPGVARARELYRTFGIDPTRLRPSSEALLRRVLDGKPWPWISNAVDLGNLCALQFLLPIGLYDAERVAGPVVLRAGRAGESYRGVRQDEVRLEGRPVLADERGPFGNPTADSLRTAVTGTTRSLWMVVFAPGSLERERFEEHLRFAAEAMARHLGPAGEIVVTS
jgi:DNA/RNA-binding domain of Phe-tRNA-synthetase-like protein